MQNRNPIMADTIKQEARKNIAKRFIQVLANLIIVTVLLFLLAGTIRWLWGWVYTAAGLFVVIINSIVLPDELIAERGKKKDNVKKWDRVISGLGIIPYAGIFAVSGLDYRFNWSPPPCTLIHITGLVLFIAGSALVTWSMKSNPFFSTLVRIQIDRDHTVSTGGPYRIIRHPGYLGFNIFMMATPLILGSIWALLPGIAWMILFIIRTKLEDDTLQAELSGYREYAQTVPYRLIPGLW